ncbi:MULTISPECIES: HNH endonuclease [unclassified Bradyrhizobium]|uniref:HNH endonuclease n=1 Tax=unclassified Bradyrhizobium TaxID=2631580 RepID=UPI001FFA232F|nr:MULTISPECIES: HNH endonuclease [unclassified Bradyrhizobium]MCK1289373.1 HNH endonuclease [Bradyrhizobium sp. 30]MCK1497891.1 HNH endonuclease [Bradyrhizobium sp. 188]
MTVQHDEARKLLPIIIKAAKSNQYLTYQDVAEKLGRPRNNARAVAQVCDLLDAAAAFADVPLLALVVVLNAQKKINPKAWTAKYVEPGIRDGIIRRSKGHTFTDADFKGIAEALSKLKGKSNRMAWKYLSQFMPSAERRRRIAGIGTETIGDAVDDLGTDSPAYTTFAGKRYARDPKVRAAVKQRANGKCEYCSEEGFKCADGSRYLECHHILALANQGADLMINVIALCPRDHREAHFGKRRQRIEAEMIEKVKVAEARRTNKQVAIEGRDASIGSDILATR